MYSVDAKQIIEAFDVCLIYIYGQRYARENAYKDDTETASQWIKEGITIEIACFVFFKEMSWMHEKFLHWHNSQDRKLIPHSLKVFNENIEAAIRKSTGEEMDEWEKTISLWRARYRGWIKNKSHWQREMWGPEPDEKGTRVPKSLMMA